MDKDNMKEKYRERLKKIIGTKFTTTMIYSLSQFEAAFGHLWGDKLEESKLTPEQLEMLALWKKCRENILNQGNHQKRNAMTELEQHDVFWRRYQSILMPVTRDGNKK